ncbi:hypothetical protein ACFQAT_28120 [Undibacterium arcticum]|uniref:Uncharacterized protein n=1 Tax=Undibacterium arcticum TaxID=1762892 RepID=A0ABV7F729_9BURK
MSATLEPQSFQWMADVGVPLIEVRWLQRMAWLTKAQSSSCGPARGKHAENGIGRLGCNN